jgi:hypothetical protein
VDAQRTGFGAAGHENLLPRREFQQNQLRQLPRVWCPTQVDLSPDPLEQLAIVF